MPFCIAIKVSAGSNLTSQLENSISYFLSPTAIPPNSLVRLSGRFRHFWISMSFFKPGVPIHTISRTFWVCAPAPQRVRSGRKQTSQRKNDHYRFFPINLTHVLSLFFVCAALAHHETARLFILCGIHLLSVQCPKYEFGSVTYLSWMMALAPPLGAILPTYRAYAVFASTVSELRRFSHIPWG